MENVLLIGVYISCVCLLICLDRWLRDIWRNRKGQEPPLKVFSPAEIEFAQRILRVREQRRRAAVNRSRVG